MIRDNQKHKMISILERLKNKLTDEELKFLNDLKKGDDFQTFSLFTDGACDFNNQHEPVNAGIGFIIYDSDGSVQLKFSANVGKKTNNEAEYLAVIEGLLKCSELGIKNLNVFSDSELVIKQLNGLYKVKNERLKILNLEVRKIVSSFESISFKHVRRELNEEADALSKEGLSK